jgi:TPR repeat protein
VPQDYRQAAFWYEKAVAQNLPAAEYDLAELYLAGKGVPLDEAKARDLMKKSAAGGDDNAKKWLAANPS